MHAPLYSCTTTADPPAMLVPVDMLTPLAFSSATEYLKKQSMCIHRNQRSRVADLPLLALPC
jgi:hypothetical protein